MNNNVKSSHYSHYFPMVDITEYSLNIYMHEIFHNPILDFITVVFPLYGQTKYLRTPKAKN